jgi:mannose-6-phosphate isomerase
MAELYPLLLLPEFKERVWGTRDLSLLYPHKSARQGGEFPQPIGEVWLTGEECRVANGALAGQTLGAVTQQSGRTLTGEAAPDATRFPLLVKFLFPKEKLSVQVHPDDAAARAAGLSNGKSECWYVLAAEPGAQVALGLQPGVTRGDVERAIAETRLEPLLRWVDLRPGDMIYVEAGTIHAIGPGAVLVETQQNSDTTYRLYDYGRPRELHVAQGLAVMKETTRAGKVPRREGGGVSHLIATPHFAVDKFVVKSAMTVPAPAGRSSCQVLVALDGCGVVEADGMRPVTFAKGECVVLPAGVREYRLQPQWALECLRAWVPGDAVPEPVTTR